MIARHRIAGIIQTSYHDEHRLIKPVQFFAAVDYGLKVPIR
jgi:hypothetical protein